MLSGGVMAASAFAPWFGTLLAELTGGFTTAFVVLALLGVVAAVLIRATPATTTRVSASPRPADER